MHPQSTMPPAVSGIYRITNTVTGECYIGSSTNVEHRWCTHRARLRGHTHHNERLQAAWDRDGESAFTIDLLQQVEPQELFAVEQAYLTRERPAYNVSLIARGGPKIKSHSAATRALISAKVRAAGKTPEHIAKLREHLKKVQKPGTPERCRQMAAANLGSKRSAETRAKMTAANTGRPVSEETRAKISAAHMGMPTHVWTDEQKKRVADAKREWWRQHKK